MSIFNFLTLFGGLALFLYGMELMGAGLERASGGKLEKIKDHSNDYCIVGNDVWVAAGAQVLHKVKIGDGAVIGGGAVVTHDVPPYAIVVGIPARIIGYRWLYNNDRCYRNTNQNNG